jgi:hypothetical protein
MIVPHRTNINSTALLRYSRLAIFAEFVKFSRFLGQGPEYFGFWIADLGLEKPLVAGIF